MKLRLISAKSNGGHALGELPPSRAEALLRLLRGKVLSGELAPGERLSLDEIALASGVSRMPVRDALKQLEAEGLVNIFPQRGIEVSALNIDDITQMVGIRIVLEQKAIALAIPKLTAADYKKMHDLLKKMDNLTGRSAAWANYNGQFHAVINEACGWPHLSTMIGTLRANVQRYVRVHTRLAGTEMAQRQHWQIYRACVEQDVERGKEVVEEHFASTANALIAALSAATPAARQRSARPTRQIPRSSRKD